MTASLQKIITLSLLLFSAGAIQSLDSELRILSHTLDLLVSSVKPSKKATSAAKEFEINPDAFEIGAFVIFHPDELEGNAKKLYDTLFSWLKKEFPKAERPDTKSEWLKGYESDFTLEKIKACWIELILNRNVTQNSAILSTTLFYLAFIDPSSWNALHRILQGLEDSVSLQIYNKVGDAKTLWNKFKNWFTDEAHKLGWRNSSVSSLASFHISKWALQDNDFNASKLFGHAQKLHTWGVAELYKRLVGTEQASPDYSTSGIEAIDFNQITSMLESLVKHKRTDDAQKIISNLFAWEYQKPKTWTKLKSFEPNSAKLEKSNPRYKELWKSFINDFVEKAKSLGWEA